MSTEFEPQSRYDVYEPEGHKLGQVVDGDFRQGPDNDYVGYFEGSLLLCDGETLGRLEGLTLIRNDKLGFGKTCFELVLQKQ